MFPKGQTNCDWVIFPFIKKQYSSVNNNIIEVPQVGQWDSLLQTELGT